MFYLSFFLLRGSPTDFRASWNVGHPVLFGTGWLDRWGKHFWLLQQSGEANVRTDSARGAVADDVGCDLRRGHSFEQPRGES